MPSRLNCERRRRGWTQQHLADLIGLHSPSTVARWEGRTRRPYRRHAVKLEAIFGMSLAALLEDDPRPVEEQHPAKDAGTGVPDAHR